VRKDSLLTGQTRSEVSAFAEKLVEIEKGKVEAFRLNEQKIADAVVLNDRRIADAVTLNDRRIADVLRIADEFHAEREKEIIDTVKGFQQTVDDLKTAVANVGNMWTADRKLIERVHDMELELTDLHAQHRMNHQTESQRNVVHREDGAPRLPRDDDDSERNS
jgi:hypothetical protein